MSVRIQQIESALTRAVSEVLQRHVSDPRVAGLVSITRVEVSPDLHDARVYVSVVPAEQAGMALHALRHAAGHIHHLLRKAVTMKRVPQLDFRPDESLKKLAAIFADIQDGVDRENARGASSAAEGQTDSAEGSTT